MCGTMPPGSYEIVVENVGEGKPLKIELAHSESAQHVAVANPVGSRGMAV